jgi:hypothetical protein
MPANENLSHEIDLSLRQRNTGQFYSFRGMHEEMNAEDLIRSHDAVEQYWSSYNDTREKMHDFRKGKQWTDEELRLMKWKNKAPVVFNKIISAVRTILGTFIQNKYDIKPAPFEPTDQDVSDVLSQRHHYHYHHTQCRYLDIDLIQEAVVGGNAWQESYVEITPGEKPRIMVVNQNPHAIYPDPNSRDLVNRFDCDFIDRASWLTLGELIERWPEHEQQLIYELESFEEDTDSSYEPEKRYANRTHETQYERNGRFKVIERFYRVKRKMWYGVDHDSGERMDIGFDDDGAKRDKFRESHPNYNMYAKSEEFLFLAIVVPVFRLTTFMQNEPYHNQPRDPVTGRIMYPLIELYAEQLDGDTNGFVEYMVGPQKVINSMMANKLHAAKHAVNTSLIYDPSKMDEDQAEDFEKHHSDGDRAFRTRPGMDPNSVVALLPQGKSAPDTNESLEWANGFHEEVSAAPPAARGLSEGNVPGILNEQRIQQAFIQLNTFTESNKLFLTKRAKLWQYYDREYFTEEETFRVIEKKNPEDPDFMTINQWVMDEYGIIKKANDISSAAYDIVFEDSWQSPTIRDKVRQQIVELQNSPAVQQDQVLNTFLTMYFLKLSDSPQELKDFVHKHSGIVQQWEDMQKQRQAQAEELDNATKLQGIAQAEAEQTAGAGAGLPVQGGPGGPQVRIPDPSSQVGATGGLTRNLKR